MSSTAAARTLRRQRARDLAEPQGGVVSRAQLYSAGWTRWQVDAEVDALRWAAVAPGVVAVHTGPLPTQARWWTAVLGVGPRVALAGLAALHAAGLTGIDAEAIDVVVPASSRPRPVAGTRAHETSLLSRSDVISVGVPRVKQALAVVQAASWARSDREAALLVVAPVQQRLVRAGDVVAALARARRLRRRRLLTSIASDVADGAQALGELDFARLCRRRGLPPPARQRVVGTSRGRCYLDVEWADWGLSAEIDGIAHLQVGSWLDDAWRQNEVVIGGRRVLRFPLLALRLDPDRAMDQTEAALRNAGWTPGVRRRRAA